MSGRLSEAGRKFAAHAALAMSPWQRAAVEVALAVEDAEQRVRVMVANRSDAEVAQLADEAERRQRLHRDLRSLTPYPVVPTYGWDSVARDVSEGLL